MQDPKKKKDIYIFLFSIPVLSYIVIFIYYLTWSFPTWHCQCKTQRKKKKYIFIFIFLFSILVLSYIVIFEPLRGRKAAAQARQALRRRHGLQTWQCVCVCVCVCV